MLTVVSVAYPLAPVRPDTAGGAEQVLWRLDAALTAAGHRSIVVACEGSCVSGTLAAFPAPAGPLDDAARAAAEAACRRTLLGVLERERADLVHMHGLDFDACLPPAGVPVLATLHLPPEWYAPDVFRLERPDTWLQCVSAAQRRRCPPCDRIVATIENGVPRGSFGARVSRRGFALALGRICPEKGFDRALDAAARADIPLLLAGVVFGYEAHERYFHEAILPRLDGRRRFIGALGPARKRRLLAAARCLVVPSLAPETSSLVAMEALASGTPVVAHPAGALADIVEDGRTGFLVENVAEMAAAILAAGELDPEDCRKAARERFSGERMVGEYLALYGRLRREAVPISSPISSPAVFPIPRPGAAGAVTEPEPVPRSIRPATGGDGFRRTGSGAGEGFRGPGPGFGGKGTGRRRGRSGRGTRPLAGCPTPARAPAPKTWPRAPSPQPSPDPQGQAVPELLPRSGSGRGHEIGTANGRARDRARDRARNDSRARDQDRDRGGPGWGAGSSLVLEEIADSAALEALAPDWAQLHARCPAATPFQRPEWLIPWWRRFGGQDLWAMALRRGGRLVALAPFFVWREQDGRRRVLLLGAGNTDYLGMLAEPGVAAEAASLVLERLEERRERWDEVELAQLRECAPELMARLPAGWRVEPGAEPCPVLSLRDPNAGGWPSAIPPDFLRRTRYYERRLHRTGDIRFELADEGTLPELLEALIRLHGERWRGRGEGGVLADVDVVAFHREAAPALLEAGVLRLHALRLDGRVVAALYALHDHGRAYYYLGGFDPELARLSPGTAIVGHAIRAAAREGLAEFDFLRGSEAYKYRWGAEDRGTYLVRGASGID